MSTLSALLAVLIVVGQPSGPVAKLRTYVSPVDYLAPEYAAPLPGAAYLYYPGERIRVDVQAVNRSNVPVRIALPTDLSRVLTLEFGAENTSPNRLAQGEWTVLSNLRVRQTGVPEMMVPAGSSLVLQPEATLVIPIEFDGSVRWPAGAVNVTMNVSLPCQAACAVVAHSNVFRFELRQTLQQADRMERHYRRALTAFMNSDLDAASQALRDLDGEKPGTVMALYLHALVAEKAGHGDEALRLFRQAEAALLVASPANGQQQIGQTRRDDLLSAVRAMIGRLERKMIDDEQDRRRTGPGLRAVGGRDGVRALRGTRTGGRTAARSCVHQIRDTASRDVVVVTGHLDYSRP